MQPANTPTPSPTLLYDGYFASTEEAVFACVCAVILLFAFAGVAFKLSESRGGELNWSSTSMSSFGGDPLLLR